MYLTSLHPQFLQSLLNLQLHLFLLNNSLLLFIINFIPQLTSLQLHLHTWIGIISYRKIVLGSVRIFWRFYCICVGELSASSCILKKIVYLLKSAEGNSVILQSYELKWCIISESRVNCLGANLSDLVPT